MLAIDVVQANISVMTAPFDILAVVSTPEIQLEHAMVAQSDSMDI